MVTSLDFDGSYDVTDIYWDTRKNDGNDLRVTVSNNSNLADSDSATIPML